MDPLLLLAVGVIFYALANRFSGGGLGWRKEFRGRPIYYASLAAMILGWFAAGWIGVLAGFTFLLWRIPGWYGGIDGGTDKGTRFGDASIMFLRAAPFALFFSAISNGVFSNNDFLTISFVFATSMSLALLVALSYDFAWNTIRPRPKDPVAVAELLAGAFWGAFFWINLQSNMILDFFQTRF